MKCFVSLAFIFMVFGAQAQKLKPQPPVDPRTLDPSPMDMNYWPYNYPSLKLDGKAKAMPVARIIYSRPFKNGRKIFGSLIPYGDVYRIGANEAAEIEFFSDVKIGRKLIPKGRYTIYYIIEADKWTIIINTDNYSLGAFSYKQSKDVLRKDIPIKHVNEIQEALTVYFATTSYGADLVFLWDDIKASLPITLVK